MERLQNSKTESLTILQLLNEFCGIVSKFREIPKDLDFQIVFLESVGNSDFDRHVANFTKHLGATTKTLKNFIQFSGFSRVMQM